MRRRVKPHRDASPRTFGTFRREVAALLAAKGMSGEEATRTVLRWDDYVKARWAAGKPPCTVSDHLMRWSKEKVVCPCKRGGDPSPRCKVHGKRRRVRRDAAGSNRGIIARLIAGEAVGHDEIPSRAVFMSIAGALKPLGYQLREGAEGFYAKKRVSGDASRRRVRRDADNPRPGEVYEAKTSGRRWEVISVDGERVTMKPVGARSDGRLVFAKSSLKGMKIMKSAVDSFLTSILGPRVESSPLDEARVARKAAIERELAKTQGFAGDPAGKRKRRLARKAKRHRRRTR